MAKKTATSKKYANPIKAYGAFWTRGFSEWAGTSSRSEFWWSGLMNAVVYFLFFSIFLSSAIIGSKLHSDFIGFVLVFLVAAFQLFYVLSIVAGVSLTTRRLHDAGLSAWHWLWLLLPIFGSIILIVFMFLPTKVAGNPYHKKNKIK